MNRIILFYMENLYHYLLNTISNLNKYKYKRKIFSRIILFLFSIILFYFLSFKTKGIIFIFFVFMFILLTGILINEISKFIFKILDLKIKLNFINNIFLIIISIFSGLFFTEGYLELLDANKFSKLISNNEIIKNRRKKFLKEFNNEKSSNSDFQLNNKFKLPNNIVEKDKFNRSLVSLPLEWQRKSLDLPNTKYSYSWHGYNFKQDENGFRREVGPFPKKRENTYRVLAVGDSLTYGEGIDINWRYTNQLERALNEDYNLEIINLGINGYQSEGIKNIVEEWAPKLQPDLIIYLFVINDYLPQDMGQYQRDLSLPIPKGLKKYFSSRTRTYKALDQGYQRMLIKLGFGLDFYDDILSNYKNYQKRFREDISEMNKYVINQLGLPPIIVLPSDAYPVYGGRGHRIIISTEKIFSEEGYSLISLEPFIKKYDGKAFNVSKFEGHPNAEGNAYFASMFYEYILRNIDLDRFKK